MVDTDKHTLIPKVFMFLSRVSQFCMFFPFLLKMEIIFIGHDSFPLRFYFGSSTLPMIPSIIRNLKMFIFIFFERWECGVGEILSVC